MQAGARTTHSNTNVNHQGWPGVWIGGKGDAGIEGMGNENDVGGGGRGAFVVPKCLNSQPVE